MFRSWMAAVSIVVMTSLSADKALAADAPDQSTPKAAAVAFYAAVERGDPAAAKALLSTKDAGFSALVDVTSEMATVHAAIRASAVKRYGGEAATVEKSFPLMKAFLGASDTVGRSTFNENGDHADVTGPSGGGVTAVMTRRDGKWYFGFPPALNSAGAAQAAKQYAGMLVGLKSIAPDIDAGRHATLDAAAAAYGEALKGSAAKGKPRSGKSGK